MKTKSLRKLNVSIVFLVVGGLIVASCGGKSDTASTLPVEAIVETNNNLEMSATLNFKVTRGSDGTEVKVNGSPICAPVTQTFINLFFKKIV